MAAPRMNSRVFREVSVPTPNSSRWKTITVTTGASASTLQDIKVPESCGGYSYRDSSVAVSCVRNRFIYWRSYQDVLEVVEESLDVTLSGNMVRYIFRDTPILPKVSVCEIHSNVVILVATVASVHRLVFPHPSKLSRMNTFLLSEQNVSSIFYDATLPDDSKNQFLLTPGGTISSHFLLGDSAITSDGHAIFALSNFAGGILMVKMPPIGTAGIVIQQELSCSSVMKKLWNGLIPGAIRGNQPAGETAVSLELVTIRGEVYIFTICRDMRLRAWSIKTKDCILVENILNFTSEDDDVPTVNASGHIIKIIQGVRATDICVFISQQNKSKFVFLTPVLDNNRLTLEHLTTLEKPPPVDLIDFVVTGEYLMSLWTTQTGDTQILTTLLDRGEDMLSSDWEPVVLANLADVVVIPPHRDPRDVYLEKIFDPGYFAPQDIVKALSVYRRMAAPSFEMESLFNISNLREEVTKAVDNEIRNNATDMEMQEESYIELQQEQWEKFYSCCYQYKQVGEKAKGLFADPVTGLFVVIKKSTFSLLRPCDPVEELYLSPSIKISQFTMEKYEVPREDVPRLHFINDVRVICDALQFVNSQISPEDAVLFQSSLQCLDPPEQLVESLADTIRANPASVSTLSDMVKLMVYSMQTIDALFYMVELNDVVESEEAQGDGPSYTQYSQLLSGALGLSVLTQSFKQMVSVRFQFVRDLAVLMTVVADQIDRGGLSHSLKDTISNELLPRGMYLLKCYKVLSWASETLSTVSPNNTLDYNLRQLSSLEINDNTVSKSVKKPCSQSIYLIQMFLEGVGGKLISQRMSSLEGERMAVWREDLIEILISLSLLIWPASDDTIFPEFLVRSCQYLRLQEYVHLLSPWCTWNEGSRAFFLGLAYLHFNEPLKAVRMFVDASDGVATEAFMSHRLLQATETDHYRLQILYYLKVIKQLEDQGYSDLVISMANEAINKADRNDPNLPTLMSKVFKEHLEMGHNQEAFAAMMNNPDIDRRKDCLRQFLVVLCERGHLRDLVSFDYQDLEDEVVHILENRARSVDMFTYDYYSLLFSHFIYREDHRKAGRIMFEKGLRLAHEVPGIKSLQQQAQCYLCTINTLRLVKPEYAWIVKPVFKTDVDGDRVGRHIKCDTRQHQKGSKKMIILELADLEKDYLLLDARLRLIRNQGDSALVSGPMPSKEEMVSLLCSAGLYDLAVTVTRAFSLSPEPILASLSLQCVSLASTSYTKTSGQEAAWLWLKENNLPPCGAKDCTAADQAWSLLQSYLHLLEDGSGQCHKCIAYALLSHGFHLPTWFMHSYQALDVAALLRVYLTFDLLKQAASLAMEYLDALSNLLIGIDGPAFKLKGMGKHSPLSVWSPGTCLDQILVALRDSDSVTYAATYQDLKRKIEMYQDKALDVSQLIEV